MTRERFAKILKEEGLSEASVELMWNNKSTDDLDEKAIRAAAKEIAAFRKAITAKKIGGSDGQGKIH